MGLDQYIRTDDKDDTEVWYGRNNHPLQEWMRQLYVYKGGTNDFNCVFVSLDEEDLKDLREDIYLGYYERYDNCFFDITRNEVDRLNIDIAKISLALRNGKVLKYGSWW